jgi:hypothetical protein
MTYTLVAQGGAVEDRHFLAQLRDAINDCLEEFRWFTLRLWSGCLTTKSRLGRREQSMVLRYLADLFLDQGKHDKAEKVFQRALQGKEKTDNRSSINTRHGQHLRQSLSKTWKA